MGLLDKGRSRSQSKTTDFTDEELKFILVKLRTAEYRGTEFETFYNVYTKVQDQIDRGK
jgi:hypothetical protein